MVANSHRPQRYAHTTARARRSLTAPGTGTRLGRAWLGAGLAWMALGMMLMPAGPSHNPSHAFQISLAVLLYLPALVLGVAAHRRIWRELSTQAAMRWFAALSAWAVLSLAWAPLVHPGSEFGRIASVWLFVLAWYLWSDGGVRRTHVMLRGIGYAMALYATYCAVAFLTTHTALAPDPTTQQRIAGMGTIGTTNYAAAAMGAAMIWLSQLPRRSRIALAGDATATLLLLVFIVLTQTRSIWLALAVCALIAPLWRRERAARWVVLAVLAAGLCLIVLTPQLLLDRGVSFRPQILRQALHMVSAHPWLGLGQGTAFVIHVGARAFTHSHNVFSQAAIELGVPGLALVLALWATVTWQAWRLRHDALGRIVLLLWIYATIALQFDMPQLLNSPRPGWLLVWLPFALLLARRVRQEHASPPEYADPSRSR